MAYGQTNYPPQQPTASYANWLQRVGAYLIDVIIVGIPGWIGSFLAASMNSGAGTAISLVLSLVSLGLLIYNRWIMGGSTGQSWGKKALKLRLIGEQTGQPIGAGMAFVRDLCHIVDAIICYIGFLFPLWDAKRQTIADKIVKTVVVTA